MTRKVACQLVSFEVMESFLRRQFGVAEPIVIDKAQGMEFIHGGKAGVDCSLVPLAQVGYDAGIISGNGRTVMFPLRAGLLLLESHAGQGFTRMCVDARYDLEAFEVAGVVSEAIYRSLGLKTENVSELKAA